MKFNVIKTSDWDYQKQIELDTIEELMKFIEENGEIVLTPPEIIFNRQLPTIEIYDTWRE